MKIHVVVKHILVNASRGFEITNLFLSISLTFQKIFQNKIFGRKHTNLALGNFTFFKMMLIVTTKTFQFIFNVNSEFRLMDLTSKQKYPKKSFEKTKPQKRHKECWTYSSTSKGKKDLNPKHLANESTRIEK